MTVNQYIASSQQFVVMAGRGQEAFKALENWHGLEQLTKHEMLDQKYKSIPMISRTARLGAPSPVFWLHQWGKYHFISAATRFKVAKSFSVPGTLPPR